MLHSDITERDSKNKRRRSVDNDSDRRKNGDEGYDSDDVTNDGRKNRKKEKSKKSGSANTDTSGVGTEDDVESRNSIEFIDFDGEDVSPRRKNNNNQVSVTFIERMRSSYRSV